MSVNRTLGEESLEGFSEMQMQFLLVSLWLNTEILFRERARCRLGLLSWRPCNAEYLHERFQRVAHTEVNLPYALLAL